MRTVAERTGKNEENGSWKPRCRVEVGEAKLPQKAERNLNTAVKKKEPAKGGRPEDAEKTGGDQRRKPLRGGQRRSKMSVKMVP